MKLSVCIPTYNRGAYLERNLPHLMDALAQAAPGEAEVCISDNASSDGTAALVERLAGDAPVPLRYDASPENVGAPRNFLRAAAMARGRYCWLLGSDDRVIPGALPGLLRRCEAGAHDILLGDRVNVWAAAGLSRVEHWSDAAREVTAGGLAGHLERCRSIGGAFSYTSAVVFRTALWQAAVNAGACGPFEDSPYVHACILLRALRQGARMRYLHEPIARNNVGDDSFLAGGYLARVAIDYQYVDIVSDVFGPDSAEVEAVRRLLRRERTLAHFLKAKHQARDGAEAAEVVRFMARWQRRGRLLVRLCPRAVIGALLACHGALRRVGLYAGRLSGARRRAE